jgi:hypothetical protein
MYIKKPGEDIGRRKLQFKELETQQCSGVNRREVNVFLPFSVP